MSVFIINYIILSLFRGFPPLNRNLVLLNRGYRSFCHKFSSSPSYSCLWPVLILRHTANNARMASADGRISGALTGSHLLQEITYTHHARASPQARASRQAPTGDLPEDLTITRKQQGKSKKYPSALHIVVGCRLLRVLNNPCTKLFPFWNWQKNQSPLLSQSTPPKTLKIQNLVILPQMS